MLYDLEVINNIKVILVKQRKTLSVAESVTSGHLQAAFSAATMASEFFQGGITAYNAGQKCRHLNIEPVYALKENCVSEQVATQMAVEVNKLFISDYGIGIAGYATTVPEIGIHELFAYFTIVSGDEILLSKKLTTARTDSIKVQVDYTTKVINALKLY